MCQYTNGIGSGQVVGSLLPDSVYTYMTKVKDILVVVFIIEL